MLPDRAARKGILAMVEAGAGSPIMDNAKPIPLAD
jgi:hypothetical protein